MKKQTDLTTESTGHIRPTKRRSHLRFALAALACALFSMACVTTSLVTEVVQKGPGETYIGQSMSIEYDKGVWNALDPSDSSQMGGTFDSLKAQGWNVSLQDGGRIQTASLSPSSLADLQAKGWKVSVTVTDKGKITTVKWSPSFGSSSGGSGSGSGSGSSGSALQDITITIDESDPQVTHYKYQTSVVLQNVDPSQSSNSGSSSGCTGDPSTTDYQLCQSIVQAFATMEADPKQKKVGEAVKAAGPPKLVFTVKLPGNIESATVNGSPGGNTSGNQVTWNITMDKSATLNMEATASGAGAGSNNPEAFGVTLACNDDFADDPGKVVCTAISANKPQDAEIEYEWKFDGATQEAKGNTLELHDVTKGVHTVTVVAIATNMNNLRSDPTSDTFTKSTGSEATATATTETKEEPTATATEVTQTAPVNLISPVDDAECALRGQAAGTFQIEAVPAGVAPDSIPFNLQVGADTSTGHIINRKVGASYSVNFGRKIELPQGEGWQLVFTIQPKPGAPSKAIRIKSSKDSRAVFSVPCGDGAPTGLVGGVADFFQKGVKKVKSNGTDVVREQVDKVIQSEASELGIDLPLDTKKQLMLPRPAWNGNTSYVAGALAPLLNVTNVDSQATTDLRFIMDVTDPAITKISVYQGSLYVLPKNTSLPVVVLDSGQHIEVSQQNVSDVSQVTDNPGDPPAYDTTAGSTDSSNGSTSGTNSSGSNSSSPFGNLSPWVLPTAAVAGVLIVLLLIFMVIRRRPRAAAIAPGVGYAPASSPSTPPSYAAPTAPMPTMPTTPLQPQDPFSAVEAQYNWMRGEIAAGRMNLQQASATLSGMTVRDAYGRTWTLSAQDGYWYTYDGRRWVRANPK